MKRSFKCALSAQCLFLTLLFILQLFSCSAPPPTSSPDTPAEQMSDFITRGEGEELTLLGVKDRAKKVYRIPEGIRMVDANAFLGCHAAQSITVPSSVTSIGNGVFRGCEQLEEISVSEQNPIYLSRGNALIHKPSRLLVSGCAASIIPSDGSVTAIGSYAFAGHTSMTTVTLPDTVTKIYDNAFHGCTALTSLTLSSSLTDIGDGAFAKCERLSKLTLPDALIKIGKNAFSGCRSLYALSIGRGLTSIGSDAFLGCTKLMEVCNASTLSLSAGSTKNGSVALYAKNVRTPEQKSVLTERDGFVFYVISGSPLLIAYNGDQTELTLPKSLGGDPYAIYDYAFFASRVTSVKIPKTVTSLGVGCFAECDFLQKVTLPSTLASIPQKAFYKCSSLTTLSIPPTVSSVEKNAFLGTPALYRCEGDVLYVDNWAVGYQTKSAELALCEGTRGIADEAFASMGAALKQMTLCEGLKYIGESAFAECTAMELSPLPSTVLRIEKNALLNCRTIQDLTLPKNLQYVGDTAFHGCTGITSLSGKDTGVILGLRVFSGCRIVNATLPAYLLPEITSDALIKATVTSGDALPQMAFFNCTALKEVTLPATIKKIGASAFQECTALTTVYFGGTRTEWNAITLGLHNAPLKTANVICK